MSDAIRFLHALAQALSMMGLYSPGHPATRRSAENLWHAIQALLVADLHPAFLFLGTAPVYQGRALHELRDWQYSARLSQVGVQVLEFNEALTPQSLDLLLERLMVRLNTGQPAVDEVDTPLAGVVFGTVAVQEDVVEPVEADGTSVEGGQVEKIVDLSDEIEAIHYVLSQAARGIVARAEAEAVARILAGLLDEFRLPQASAADQLEHYHAAHPINTALLAMAAAIGAGVDTAGRHRLGVIALLHNIGMARLPADLGSQETLSAEDRARVETHTGEGARLLVEAGGAGLELAAVVAYEHHLRPDGSGYPVRRFRASAHWASRLVGSCAAYTSLRAVRPYRPAWPVDRAVRYLEDGAGTIFDPEAARLVAGVVRSP